MLRPVPAEFSVSSLSLEDSAVQYLTKKALSNYNKINIEMNKVNEALNKVEEQNNKINALIQDITAPILGDLFNHSDFLSAIKKQISGTEFLLDLWQKENNLIITIIIKPLKDILVKIEHLIEINLSLTASQLNDFHELYKDIVNYLNILSLKWKSICEYHQKMEKQVFLHWSAAKNLNQNLQGNFNNKIEIENDELKEKINLAIVCFNDFKGAQKLEDFQKLVNQYQVVTKEDENLLFPPANQSSVNSRSNSPGFLPYFEEEKKHSKIEVNNNKNLNAKSCIIL